MNLAISDRCRTARPSQHPSVSVSSCHFAGATTTHRPCPVAEPGPQAVFGPTSISLARARPRLLHSQSHIHADDCAAILPATGPPSRTLAPVRALTGGWRTIRHGSCICTGAHFGCRMLHDSVSSLRAKSDLLPPSLDEGSLYPYTPKL